MKFLYEPIVKYTRAYSALFQGECGLLRPPFLKMPKIFPFQL